MRLASWAAYGREAASQTRPGKSAAAWPRRRAKSAVSSAGAKMTRSNVGTFCRDRTSPAGRSVFSRIVFHA